MSESEPGRDRPALRDAEVTPPRASLREILERLPAEPGVYIMRDAAGKPLYVGKAASLRARVRQYFQRSSGDTRDFVPLLEGLVADIETVVTANEKEALLLENTLIKQHQPRFNVKLTDDKNYLVLRLDPEAEWPRLEVVRRMRDDRAHYFGPYHSATACREALRVVNRHFQLRTCTDHVLANRRRPCLQYQIKRCPAPCVLPVARDEYAEQVRDVRLFLVGKKDELLVRLRARMRDASARTEFERAARARDQIHALEATLEEQRMVSPDFLDQDAIGFHREGMALEVTVMTVRQGKVEGSRAFSFAEQEFPDDEILSSFLGLYYDLHPAGADEVLLPFAISDAALKAEWLTDKRAHPRGRKVLVLVPQRGPRHDLVELARKNAAASFASRRSARADAELTLAKLQRRLRLPVPPRVIECYDVSHIQGAETVASMVVFTDGAPDRARYRRYKVRRTHGPDDYAAMYEVLARRFRRGRGAEGGLDQAWRLPDLVVVDGGKGQLGMALAAARDVGVTVPIVALAKEKGTRHDTAPELPALSRRTGGGDPVPDRVFLPSAKDAIAIRPQSAEMFVLQALRDEAHRFAVAFHRAERRRRTLRSALSSVPGIGPTRQRDLLRHFGSLKKIRESSLEDLLAVPGMTRPAAMAVVVALGANPAAAGAGVSIDTVAPPPEAAPGLGTPADTDEDAAAADEDALESAFAGVEPEGLGGGDDGDTGAVEELKEVASDDETEAGSG